MADPGKNLSLTIILRYPDLQSIPRAITLRTGLALSLAVEDFAPALAGMFMVKWPNDLMLGPMPGAACGVEAALKTETAFKAAGILTEADGGTVFIGIGVNVAQTEFPRDLRARATSIHLALQTLTGAEPPPMESPKARFRLLERILVRLRGELEPAGDAGDWRRRLEERLYLLGRDVQFVPGAADSDAVIEGRILGIGPEGELRILPRGETEVQSFITGELRIP
jgi:BirA family biotin operon repressor/biotin-[acetyl-CoA-carboxylase] ligase